MDVPSRPKFSVVFADILKLSASTKGMMAFVPVRFLLCLGMGAIAGVTMPETFWWSGGSAESAYAALLAFNGLVLALGWGVMSRIYDILMHGAVSRVLVKRDLLAHHLASVELAHAILILSALVCALSMIVSYFDAPLIIDRMLFSSCLCLSLYSLSYVWSIMAMMTDLSWENAHASSDDIEKVVMIKKNGS